MCGKPQRGRVAGTGGTRQTGPGDEGHRFLSDFLDFILSSNERELQDSVGCFQFKAIYLLLGKSRASFAARNLVTAAFASVDSET